MAICDSSRREVHAIAAQHPVAVLRLVRELPDERVSLHGGRTEVRLISLDVVDDPIPRRGSHAAGMLGQLEAQWKYWPPSMTIVCPVMKSAAGEQRKTTAPTTSSGT